MTTDLGATASDASLSLVKPSDGRFASTFDLARLAHAVGRTAVSDWIEVPQDVIARFADATGDHQWIHLDVDRARRESPYGGTVAHGFLTLSLVSVLMCSAVRLTPNPRLTINCGLNRVRFQEPLATGSRVRGRFELVRVEPLDGAVQAVWAVAIECDATSAPCCVCEWLLRYCT
jgi:acyl dehydratase